MTFDEFKTQVQARWPTKRWHFDGEHGRFSAWSHSMNVSWRTELGWVVHHCVQARGHTLTAAVKHARNAINRARKALDKENTP